MDAPILGADGAIAHPAPCLYHLITGQVLFSKTAVRDGDFYVFQTDETALVQVKKTQNEQTRALEIMFGGLKLSDPAVAAPFMSTSRWCPISSIAYLEDCSDPEALKRLESAVSRLIHL